MKSIYKEGQGYQRVSNEVAEKKVKTGGFKYVSKSEHKASLIEVVIIPKEIKEDKEFKRLQKLAKRKKLGEKQYE